MSRPLPGIYLVHKPVGPTSFSVVRGFQDELAAAQGRRLAVAHGGTLDPFAHGLLLVLVGQATKLFDDLHAVPKTYEADVCWGVETDTGDLHGRPVTPSVPTASGAPPTPVMQTDGVAPSIDLLRSETARFLGWQEQIPPATSSKRVDGERAYEKAHRGEEFVLPPSRVYLHAAEWISPTRVRLVVRGGFYVRSFIRDLGRAVGGGAHLTTLWRSAIGPWVDPGPLGRVHVTGRDLLSWLPSRELSDADVGVLRRGESISENVVAPPGWHAPEGFPISSSTVRGFHLGRFVMLLERSDGRLSATRELFGGL